MVTSEDLGGSKGSLDPDIVWPGQNPYVPNLSIVFW
jgi:hypothetical protein